jgi:hypothetical protein
MGDVRMALYFNNTYVAWEGIGWYILKPETPMWKSQWEKAETMEEMYEAGKNSKQVAFLRKQMCEEVD